MEIRGLYDTFSNATVTLAAEADPQTGSPTNCSFSVNRDFVLLDANPTRSQTSAISFSEAMSLLRTKGLDISSVH